MRAVSDPVTVITAPLSTSSAHMSQLSTPFIVATWARTIARIEATTGGSVAPEPVSREDLAARIAEGSVTVLDVRPADEYAAGHIPGALNATLTEIERIVPTLDPAAEIVAYCRGPYCIYAHQAVAALRKHGFNPRRLDGGLPEWREDGRQTASVS